MKKRRIAPAPVSQEEQDGLLEQRRQSNSEKSRLAALLDAEQQAFADVGCEKELVALLRRLRESSPGECSRDEYLDERHEKMVRNAKRRAATTMSASEKKLYQAMTGNSYVKVYNVTILDEDDKEQEVQLCRNCKLYYQNNNRYLPKKAGRPKKQQATQLDEKRTCVRCGNSHSSSTKSKKKKSALTAGFVQA